MTEHNFDASALFTIPKPYQDAPEAKGYLIKGRAELWTTLRHEYGIDTHVSRGIDSIKAAENIVEGVTRPEYQTDDTLSLTNLGDRALSGYGVFRSYGPPLATDRLVTSLNPMNLRTAMRNKHKVGNDILDPLKLYRNNMLISAGVNKLSESDIAIADEMVLKPNGGFASRDIFGGTPTELLEVVNLTSNEDRLLEERLDFSPPLPMVRGIDEHEQARLDQANRDGVNKELRLYTYGGESWYPVVRVAERGTLRLTGNEWVYIDEDTVPSVAMDTADIVKERIDKVVGDNDTLLAIDMVFVKTKSRPEPHWEVMEVNAEPYIPRPDTNKPIGRTHQRKLTEQINRLARKSRIQAVE